MSLIDSMKCQGLKDEGKHCKEVKEDIKGRSRHGILGTQETVEKYVTPSKGRIT